MAHAVQSLVGKLVLPARCVGCGTSGKVGVGDSGWHSLAPEWDSFFEFSVGANNRLTAQHRHNHLRLERADLRAL